MKFPKKQAQRLIPEYLLDYTTKLNESHPDPTESWGGGSGGSYTSGDGITINDNVISVDNTIARKSEIPTKTSELTNDSDFITSTALNDYVTTTQLDGKLNDYALKSDIPSLDGYATQTWVQEQGYSKFSGSYNDLTDKPILSTVATSGSYNDLIDKPTIPDTSKLVTLDTDQTITGVKTFNNSLRIEDTVEGKKSYIFPDRVQYMDTNQDIEKVTLFALPTSKPSGSEYTLATIDDIPDTSKFVTTDTAQTISGAKTFNGGLITENTTFGMKMNIVPSRFTYDYNNQGTIERTLFDLPTNKTAGTEQEPTTYTIATTDDVHNPTITFTQGGTTKGTITLNQSGDQTIEFDAGGSSGGGKLYLHKIHLKKYYLYDNNDAQVGMLLHLYNNITTSSNQPMTLDTYKGYFRLDKTGYDYGFATSGRADMNGASSIIAVSFTNNNFANIQYFQYKNSSSSTSSKVVKFDSVDGFEDIVMEV